MLTFKYLAKGTICLCAITVTLPFSTELSWGESLKPPYSIDVYRHKFRLLWRQGRLKEGRQVADQALKYFGGDADLHNMRAIAALDQGDLQASLLDSSKAITICPTFVGPYTTKGCALYGLGRTKESLCAFDKAIELSQGRYSFPYSQRAIVYFRMDMIDKAQKDLRKAIAISSKDARARQLQGDLYYRKGQYRMALNEYNQAVAYAPAMADLYCGRASIRLKLDDTVGALNDFDAALNLKPENKETLLARGMLAANLGDFEEAMQDIHNSMLLPPKALVKIHKKPNVSRASLAPLLAGYDQLINRNPAEADSYYHRGLLLLCAGRAQQAERDLTKYLELSRWKGRGAIFGALALNCAYGITGKNKLGRAVIVEADRHCGDAWPRPLLNYLLGKEREEALFASIKRTDQATVAHCYVALDLLSHGKAKEAAKHFDWLAREGDNQMDEYFLSLYLSKKQE